MTEYEQLGTYQQELVSYVYQHSNRLSHEECMAWLDKYTPAWRETNNDE